MCSWPPCSRQRQPQHFQAGYSEKIMRSADIIEKNCFRKKTLVDGLFILAAAGLAWLFPEVAFDRRLAPILFLASIPCFAVFIFFERCAGSLNAVMSAISLAGVCMLAFVTHVSGGIASPLTYFYFALLVSEIGCGVTSNATMYASLVSYLCVILGEASGWLTVSDQTAKAIYGRPAVLGFLVVLFISYLAMTGYMSKLIFKKIKHDFTDGESEKQAVLGKFHELDAYTHIGMLAHRIVHDLRGPLSIVSGYVEMQMLAPGKNAEEKNALLDLSKTVTQMSESLGNVTRFGRVTEGKAEKIMIKEFFKNLISILAYYKDAQSVQFRQNYPEAGDPCVMAVRQDLQQAYFNILKNAIEAVGVNTGDKIVEVSMRREDGTLEISIRDNGPGIPEEILPKIFKQCVSGKADGTGVGLLVTRDLLLKNNLSIEIRNAAVTGVNVITRLPVCGGGKH